MRVLLTGAAGFIGSHVARLLVEQRHDVAIVVKPTTDLGRIEDVLPHVCMIYGELPLTERIFQQVKPWEPDVCVHLAWKSGDDADNLKSLEMSVDLLRRCVQMNCQRFVFAGTCFDDPPIGVYGACKRALTYLHPGSNPSCVTARIHYCYGPREDERRLVPTIIRGMLKGDSVDLTLGEQVRDYMHVHDVATAIWEIARSLLVGSVDVATGIPATIEHMAAEIYRLHDPDVVAYRLGALPYREDEPMFVLGDPTRLRSLGWTPHFNLRDGLKDTIRWWQSQQVPA